MWISQFLQRLNLNHMLKLLPSPRSYRAPSDPRHNDAWTERRPWLLAPKRIRWSFTQWLITQTDTLCWTCPMIAERRPPGPHSSHFVRRTQAMVGAGDRVELRTWKCTLCGCFDNLVERRWGFPVRLTLLRLNDNTICHKRLSCGGQGSVGTPATCWTFKGSAQVQKQMVILCFIELWQDMSCHKC